MWSRYKKIYLRLYGILMILPHPPLIGSQFSEFSHLYSASNEWHPPFPWKSMWSQENTAQQTCGPLRLL